MRLKQLYFTFSYFLFKIIKSDFVSYYKRSFIFTANLSGVRINLPSYYFDFKKNLKSIFDMYCQLIEEKSFDINFFFLSFDIK